MAFRCPRCGGSAVFDAEAQMLRCEYCDSVFSPEEFQVKDKSKREEIPQAGLTLYSCSSCGAELQGTEDSIVGFCPYCGGQSMLRKGITDGDGAEYVLPFQISREQCPELYSRFAKKVRYLPKTLKDPEHLKSFTGIYMPYYEYGVEMGAANISGTKTVESHARYDVVNTYRIDAAVEGGTCRVPYDASRYLDDEIADRTLPFDMSKARPFAPSYLSGFYADASTVPSDTYFNDAAQQASKDVVEEVAEQIYARDGITVDKAASSIAARTRSCHKSLLPMWFLTWRNGNRVAYAVINGESGKVVSDLPVDMKSFGFGCIAIAAVLFAVLELLFQPTPLLTSVISLIAGMLMASSVSGSTKRIFEKQTHANDKGWRVGEAAEPAEPKPSGKKKKTKKLSSVHPLLWVVLIVVVGYLIIPGLVASLPQLIAAAAALYLILELRRVAIWQRSIPEKQPLHAIVLVLLGVILNAAIVLISPVNDGWYYLGDALCILILILAAISMTKVYNIGATRPLPKLFDRNEVG